MAKTLELVINAAYKGSAAFKRAQTDVKDLEKGSKQAGKGVGDAMRGMAAGIGVAGAAFAAIGMAAKAAWDTLGEGAALATTQGNFERLAVSIGSTADALLNDLTAATRGMVAEFDLMASAGELMSLGLTKTHDQTVRMAAAAGQLGWDMNMLRMEMNNMTGLRLDSLGLEMDKVKKKAKEFEAAGMSAKEAWGEAIITMAEQKMDLIQLSDTEVAMRQIEASTKDAGDAFKLAFAEGLSSDIQDTAGSVEALGDSWKYAADEGGRYAAAIVSIFTRPLTQSGMHRELKELREEYQRLGGDMDIFSDKYGQVFALGGNLPVEALSLVIAALQNDLEGLARAQKFSNDQGLASQRAQEAAAQGLLGTGAAAAESAAALSEWTDEAKKAAIARAELADFNISGVEGATQSGIWAAAGAHIQGILDEFAAEAAEAEEEIAEANRQAAEEAARAWEEYAGRVAGAFDTAIAGLQDWQIPDLFGTDGAANADAVGTAIYNMGVSAGGTAGQLGELGVALGQFDEDVAEAAIKAAIFTGALEILSKEWKIGAISTDEFINSVNQVVTDLENNTVIDLETRIADKADGFQTPVRVPVQPDWIEGDPTALTGAPVKVPVELTVAESALQQAMNAAAIPEAELQEEFVFTANVDAAMASKDEVVTAVVDAETIFTYSADVVEAMSARDDVVIAVNDADPYFEFFANDDDVWQSIRSIDGKRLKVYVDYVPSGSGASGGGSGGGASSGGSSGGGGNSGWGGYGGFNANMNVTFNGPAEPRAVTRAVHDGMAQFYADLDRAGVPR